jgi:Bacterial Ig-like domain (group 1)
VRALLCAALLSFVACSENPGEGPSATGSSIVIVLNGSAVAAGRAALAADAVDSVTIAIAIRDHAGRPLANLPLRVEVTGSRNVVTPAAASLTDVNGLYIANLTTTASGTKTIRVIADPGPNEVVLDDTPSVTFEAGPPVRFEVVDDAAGGSTLVGRDFFGNVTREAQPAKAPEDR